MDIFINIISERFTWGALLGLILLFFSWKNHLNVKKHLKKELKLKQMELDELQSNLRTQLKISSKGNESIQGELDELRKQNENLRINLQTLQLKPGKAEMRHLRVTDLAVQSMREQAPGFAQAWELALKKAEEQMEESENGIRKIMRKVVSSIKGSGAKELDMDSSNYSEKK